MSPFEWMLVVGVVLAFLALLWWTGATVGSWLLDLLVALLPFDEDDVARWLWRVAVVVLIVGSLGKLATDGI